MQTRRCLRLLFLVLPGLLFPGCRRASLLPAEIGMWYWHSPFLLTDADREGLKQIGVTTMYVRAGTFASDGQTVSLILPQTWAGKADGLHVVLVYNFHPGLVKHLEALTVDQVAEDVAARVRKSWDASSKMVHPEGVQFDVDCPTRLLPRYAEILRGIRTRLTAGGWKGSFSATALPTWLTSKNIAKLAAEVDFLAPQFYEGRTGKTANSVFPVSDPEGLKEGLKRLDRLGFPCQIGLATYGHALLFDDHQSLVGMYRGLSAEDALRHPSFIPEASEPIDAEGRPATAERAVGEDRLVLRAVHPDKSGQGIGFRVAYLLPTPEMVTRQLAAFNEERPANAKGIILFRFPEAGESMSLPLASIVAGMGKAPATVDAQVSLRTKSVPWSLIGTQNKSERPPQEVSVHLDSVGASPSRASRDAVQLLLSFNRPGIDGVAPGDFDDAEIGTVDEKGRFATCARALADCVRFRRYHLLPGDKLRSGPVLLPADGATQAWTRWVAQGPGGFKIFSGESSAIQLSQDRP